MLIETYNATNTDTNPIAINGLTNATATHLSTVNSKNANANYPGGYNSKCSLYQIEVTNYQSATWNTVGGDVAIVFK